MALTPLRHCVARTALRATRSRHARIAGTSFVRGKATLPDLPYSYSALEPSISGKIMELHHKNHHQTYVNSLNTFSAQLADAISASDAKAQASLVPLINFHAGGHINHSLFWENLAPAGKGGGGEPVGELGSAIREGWKGGLEEFKGEFNKALAGVQGSGWVWLVRNKTTGAVAIKSYANQDPVLENLAPILGIDAWEHAYYLQYQNRKAEYFSAIWDVINWEEAGKRFNAAK